MKNKRVVVIAPTNSMHSFRWCRQLEQAGFDPILISTVSSSRGDEEGRLHLVWPFLTQVGKNGWELRFRKVINRLSVLALAAYSLALRPVFINIHYLTAYPTRLAYLFCRFMPRRLIVTCWGTDVNRYFADSKGRARRNFRRIYGRAYLVTCDSPAIQETILSEVPEANIAIIPWGIDLTMFPQPDEHARLEARRFYRIPMNATVFLSNRFPTRNYNLDAIISWFIEYYKQDSNAILLLHAVDSFADGSCETALAVARRHPAIRLSEKLLPYAALPSLYAASDFYLSYPTIDAAPVSMLEGIASGLLVLASDQIPAYRYLANRYSLNLISLQKIDRPFITSVLAERETVVDGNLGNLWSQDSIEACAKMLMQRMQIGRII
jgi:glycosyltransferase involved in cell wall biosynthesis